MKDIKVQFEYISKRIMELINLCEKDNTPDVSSDVRNVAQDIITRLNRLLDNIIFSFFVDKIKPNLSEEIATTYEKLVQFPLSEKIEDLKPQLNRFGANNLNIEHPQVFSIIESVQPYNQGMECFRYLRKYSNLGHRVLIPQNKKKDISLNLADSVKISDKGSVVMNGCFIRGIPVKRLEVNKGVITGDIDPRLNPKIEIKVSYLLEGDNIDVLWLCKNSLTEIEKIITAFANVK